MTPTFEARGPAPTRGSRSVLRLAACLVAALVAAWGVTSLRAQVVAQTALSAVTPGGATPGVSIQIIGTGFAAAAGDSDVIFTPAPGAVDGDATPVPAPVVSIAVVDARKDARRLQVVLPAGLPVGPANVSVRNRLTGQVASGRTVQVIALQISQPVVALPGATGIQVRIVGSANTRFASGSLAANFGLGVSATSLTAISPTEVVATVRVDRRAPLGPRVVELVTPTQRGLVPVGFSVGTAPANRQPAASVNGPYAGVAGAAVALTSAGSSDPDGDSLTYAWRFGDGGTSSDPYPTHTWTAAGSYPVDLTVSDGRGGVATATTTARIDAPPNRAPRITSTPSADATEGVAYVYDLSATDPDGDPVTFTLLQAPTGMTTSGARLTWTPSALQAGGHDVSVQADDGRGGLDTQTFRVQVTALVRLTGIDVVPGTVRFAAPGGTRPLTVTGRRSDGTTADLTPGAAGTIYDSSNAFVARVSADGAITAVADGEATVTVRSGGFAVAVPVVVESGVTLDALDLTPADATLRQVGATQALQLRGRFSDQTIRDLTTAPGARFTSSDARIVAVDGPLATAVANGQVTITATIDTLSTTAVVSVALAGGTGVLRGEVYDDSRGLPLVGARVTLIEDGGGAPAAPVETLTDARGRFALPGRAGEVVVRVTRDGFTPVDRTGTLAGGQVTTLLDARLTPVDTTRSVIPPVFGGEARDGARTLTLTVSAGALAADAAIHLTRLSAQGLAGRLPLGWSPVAGADILADGAADGLRFAQAATLRFPNTASFGEGSSVPVARYDHTGHRWVAVAPGRVSADGLGIEVTVAETGQYVALAADVTPFAPPDATPGRVLEGVAFGDLPADAVAAGEVTPRAAPPGDDVRATGRLTLAGPTLFPSGTAVQARVREQFTLSDSSEVRPEPFTQDLLVHGQPRPSGGRLGTTFPITPSRQYSLQELARGVVTIDITAQQPGGGSVVGASGGTVSDAEGDSLVVPAGVTGSDASAALRRLPANGGTNGVADDVAGLTPAGYELLAALDVDLSVALSGSAQLAIARPSGLADDAQLLVALRFTDPLGGTRLRLVALGLLEATRVVSSPALQGLTLDGVRGTGTYLFLRALSPVAFVTGRVLGLDGLTPHPQTLVTADGSPFADLTGVTGRYVLPAPAGVALQVRVLDTGTRDGASASTTLAAARTVGTLDVTLAVVSPFVVAVSPAAGADAVALDDSVTISFSEALAPSSVSEASVQLRAGASAIAVQRTLSADRLRIILRPLSPLDGRTTHTVVATAALRDPSGNALVPFSGSSFTTLDPSKPPQPAPGQVTAEIPDEDGLTLVVGTPGAAAGGTAVTGTNLRTQETVTVLALADGSFRFRLGAIVGDEIALTFRDGTGRETTVTLSQFGAGEGPAGIGLQGGTIRGAGGRIGTVLPRALSTAGLFSLTVPAGVAAGPTLPSGLAYVDRFRFSPGGSQFSRLASLTLSESQNRFPAQTASAALFAAEGSLVVPPDFLTNATVRFTAVAQDAAGNRQTVTGATTVVAAGPDAQPRESAQLLQFPTVVLTVPRESQPNQQLSASAIAPAARVDLSLPPAAVADSASTLLLARVIEVGGQPRLAVVDRLEVVGAGAERRLRTTGRTLPGLTAGGDYVVVASADPLVLATGRASGPAAVVGSDDLPFVFETGGPNAPFAVPVRAGQPFTLRFVSAATGASLGDASGTAPSTGAVNVGTPLAGATTALTVTASPDDATLVDIGAPVTWTFPEAVESISLSNAALVTDSTGNRIYGRIRLSSDGRTATFTPLRRWAYGRTYRWGLSTALTALSGARLAAPAAGQFTTFAPSVLASGGSGVVRATAVSDTLGLAATTTGLSVLDLASPRLPRELGRLTIDGGATAVAFLGATTITGRDGLARTGRFAVVAAGSVTTAGRLLVVDLGTPASPVIIGSTPLTRLAGGVLLPGAPDLTGIPSDLALTATGHAIVAITGGGVVDVDVAQTVPVDPVAAHGITSRYPAVGSGSASGVTTLGPRRLAAGVEGLTVLDGALVRQSGVAASTVPLSVAALPAFPLDVNGDGTVAVSEVLDLAVVSGGTDGTVQVYRVQATGDPVLLSVVRLPGTTAGVEVSAAERLAWVGLGGRGLAVIDLDGPASVQPIDDDRDGVDDRVLAVLDTPGEVSASALALERGLGLVADGNASATVAQLLPPRTRFTGLVRDPIAGHVGDEQAILARPEALVTDEALAITVEVQGGDRVPLSLVIDEQPVSGGRALSFDDGSRVRRLADGTTTLAVVITPGTAGARALFRVQDDAGRTVTRLDLRLSTPDVTGLTLRRLFVTPEQATLDATTDTVQLKVGGVYSDGRTLNVTGAGTGTSYRVDEVTVATVGADGLVTGLAGGAALVEASNAGQTASAELTITKPAVLARLEALRSTITLRTPAAVALPIVGILTDGTEQPLGALTGITFTVDTAGVLTVSATGDLTPVAAGTARVTATVGALSTEVFVAVDLRSPASVTALDLRPFGTVTVDTQPIRAIVQLAGTGSLDGVSVAVALTGPRGVNLSSESDTGGGASVSFTGLVAGSYTVTATAIDPATGQTRQDVETLVVGSGAVDLEPNDDPATASVLTTVRPVSGSVTAGSDPRDDFRLEPTSDGRMTVTVQLQDGADPAAAEIVIRAADGTEIRRVTPTSRDVELDIPVTGAGVTVSLQARTGTIAYQVSTEFSQAPITITGVTPLAGPAGTPVVISGTGFSRALADTTVLFGGIGATVVAASPTRLDVLVPASAVNGPIQVTSGSREATGPQFNAGNATRAVTTMADPLPGSTREEPVSGLLVNITRLSVEVDPSLGRDQVQAMAQTLNGGIAGYVPSANIYYLDFPSNQTFDGLRQLRAQLSARPGVRSVGRSLVLDEDRTIDQRDTRARWPRSHASLRAVWQQVKLFDAVDAIRQTPPFHRVDAIHRVKIALIDDGFSPNVPTEFHRPDGTSYVTLMKRIDGIWTPIAPQAFGAHGTGVTSVATAGNNGSSINGVLGALTNAGEDPPFDVVVYLHTQPDPVSGRSVISDSLAVSALDHIRDAGDFDVVSMSFGVNCGSNVDCMASDSTPYQHVMATMRGRTLVVMSAGNDGVTGDTHSPSALAMFADQCQAANGTGCLTNVMSIGATAVINEDRTGERADRRAVFPGRPERRRAGNVVCKPSVRNGGSNCLPGVTLAAPGEDYFVVGDGGRTDYRYFNGTSAATPAVAGAAALLQTIRDTVSPLSPEQLKRILVQTADDVGDLDGTWDPSGTGQRVGRLNILAAVREVLPADDGQRVYVSDAALTQAGAGHLLGLEVNPLTGARELGNSDAEVPLTLEGTTFQRPSAVAMAPTGNRAYVIAEGPAAIGPALLAVNTRDLRVESAVALSAAVTVTRPSIALSKDGRLAYIATGAAFVIVDTEAPKVVATFADLPAPYNELADTFDADALAQRFAELGQRVTSQLQGRAGSFTNVTLSPDGRALFLTVSTGGGTGFQNGFVLPLNVDLYTDVDPDSFTLESSLVEYLRPAYPGTPVLEMRDGGTAAGGDEPSAAVVSADGKYLYLTNGGVGSFANAPNANGDPRDALKFNELTFATTGGLILEPEVTSDIVTRLRAMADSGVTLLDAPGNTGIFSLGATPAPSSYFPSEVVHGWMPTFINGGRIVNQVLFPAVYAKRPFGMAQRPDGNRALVTLFQTGNFGVLDLEAQQRFPLNPSNDRFDAFVGVTPAIRMSAQLWPSRGAFQSPDGTFVPSPDERLMFPTAIEYAQNGRFAVAVHGGTRPPGSITAELPAFATDNDARLSLSAIGFTVAPGQDTGTDPDGVAVNSQELYTFKRGGGAVSIISDAAITRDLDANAGVNVLGSNGFLRPYHTEFPVCNVPETGTPGCVADVYRTLFEYSLPGASRAFETPRAVGIQPFVYVESPRWGDNVFKGTRVRVGWREASVAHLRVRVTDMGEGGGGDPVQLDTFAAALTSLEKRNRSSARMFKSFFVGGVPVSGHVYQLEIAVLTDAGEVVSLTSHEVTLQ